MEEYFHYAGGMKINVDQNIALLDEGWEPKDGWQVYKKDDKDYAVLTEDEMINESNPGGIDLTQSQDALQTKTDGEDFVFDIDPALLAQFQNAPGFEPVIINVQPMTDLKAFLDVG